MERSYLFEQLTGIFSDTLDIEDVILEETTQASDIDEWDSLTHIMLVVAIEKHFDIRLTSKEIQSWKNVGEMINSIDKQAA